MKVKKISFIFILVVFMVAISIPVFANHREQSPLFMGEILEVNKNDGGNMSLLVEGYIKGDKIFKEKLKVIVAPDTKIINCGEDKCGKVTFVKGDTVFIVLSDAMTKSIPPQTTAKKIVVCKPQ